MKKSLKLVLMFVFIISVLLACVFDTKDDDATTKSELNATWKSGNSSSYVIFTYEVGGTFNALTLTDNPPDYDSTLTTGTYKNNENVNPKILSVVKQSIKKTSTKGGIPVDDTSAYAKNSLGKTEVAYYKIEKDTLYWVDTSSYNAMSVKWVGNDIMKFTKVN